MSREKIAKLEVKSSKEDSVSEERENKRIISFDLYFQLLMKKGRKIYPHHKAPMLKYAEQAGLVEATEEEFDSIFRNY